ncbi:Glutamate-1-semialdehyde 2,1-aminomutase, chloroplastic [Hondaea fermentalgiana]|uniref:Glutamate-1-semialdehyde 2,1-aminomutase, chloroplastic n=1 Tax=Hondaea fermentalgiana TaxID=2315210 RepID=A0A2R5GKH4_9STRA|nr:Glutamate-1-semialdehyde 2,1-aminomutase, chloroplastic [Hondaea fermentalgiana]|eukprot:GBG29123.1 Glutamate-1-semialdehyde 2,1-aminomutase, chloroplastic [Hondaea fermentalgiana]
MVQLVQLLPGGEETWLCADNDDACKFHPVTVMAFGCFLLAQAPKMSQMSATVSLIFVTCALLVAYFPSANVVPAIAIEALGVVMVAIHVPMLNRKQSYAFMATVALFAAGKILDEEVNVKVLFAAVGVGMLGFRIFLELMTLRAATPTPLIFPIVSHIMPRWAFSDREFFRTDNPPEEVAQKREQAFNELNKHWQGKFPKSIATSSYLADKFSDLRFAAGNRVFIPFQRKLEGWCDPCTVLDHVEGTDLIDVDGHRLTDVSGSYGVNVCGYEEYKRFISEGWDLTKNVGCVLGPLHPLVRENIDMLRQISKKEEVSFHMSGTEAVMAAIRLVRYNTRKKYVVIFGGAYHGWYDGVQSMAGNERVPGDILTLKDMSPASMDVIRLRAHEIAAVMINPLQAFHPNAPPPSDLVLASNTRGASSSTQAYKTWLEQMRETCTRYGITLMFDEVYTGFRLAPGGAQEYFSVEADIVTYGKTLGGGIANGICCGPSHLMRRSDPVKPLRVAYVIGTFAAQPILVGAMNVFLKWVTSPGARNEYNRLRTDVSEWVVDINARLEKEFPETSAPIQIAAYASVWTILYKRPGRYHWMLQYLLKDEGLNLSWVGTGRLSFSLDFKRDDLDKLTEKIVRACHRMENDGWWWYEEQRQPSKMAIQLSLVGEIVRALFKRMISF